MRNVLTAFAAAIVVTGIAAATPAKAQQYNAQFQVLKTRTGAILVKHTSYESGDELAYSFECIKGKKALTFYFFNPPDDGSGDSEGVDYESQMPFSVTGLKPFPRCGPYCSKLVAALNDPPLKRPPGGIGGPMTWVTFNKHINETITQEPRPPKWHYYKQFAAASKRRIAEFRQMCAR